MKNDFIAAIGIAVKNLRLQKNVSQEELARISGISRSYISRLEAGKGNPSLDQVQRIAKALGAKATIIIT
jgi:transcriptional regulator with XRE-family HTH domain